MKKLPVLILVVTSTVYLTSCSAQSVSENETLTTETVTKGEEIKPVSEDVDAETFKSLIESGEGLLIDVRTPEEYASGHIAGSINIDFYSSTFDAQLDSLSKSSPVYVYCQGGGRSGKAKDQMASKGFNEVYNLIGGFGNWPY